MTPGDSAEQAVLAVLRDLLDDPGLGAADDFYAVGGHSLLIVQVQRRLRTEYGLDLDVRQFARNAQLAALAAACRPLGEPGPGE